MQTTTESKKPETEEMTNKRLSAMEAELKALRNDMRDVMTQISTLIQQQQRMNRHFLTLVKEKKSDNHQKQSSMDIKSMSKSSVVKMDANTQSDQVSYNVFLQNFSVFIKTNTPELSIKTQETIKIKPYGRKNDWIQFVVYRMAVQPLDDDEWSNDHHYNSDSDSWRGISLGSCNIHPTAQIQTFNIIINAINAWENQATPPIEQTAFSPNDFEWSVYSPYFDFSIKDQCYCSLQLTPFNSKKRMIASFLVASIAMYKRKVELSIVTYSLFRCGLFGAQPQSKKCGNKDSIASIILSYLFQNGPRLEIPEGTMPGIDLNSPIYNQAKKAALELPLDILPIEQKLIAWPIESNMTHFKRYSYFHEDGTHHLSIVPSSKTLDITKNGELIS